MGWFKEIGNFLARKLQTWVFSRLEILKIEILKIFLFIWWFYGSGEIFYFGKEF